MINALLKLDRFMSKYSRPYGKVIFYVGIVILLVTLFSALVWSLDPWMLVRGFLLVILGLYLTGEKDTSNVANLDAQ